MELPYDPVISLLEIFLKKPKMLIWKNICSSMFIVMLFTIAKIWKLPQFPSLCEWIKKLWYIYTVEYYLTVNKKKILPFVTAWIDLENITLSKISQSEKDKSIQFHLFVESNEQKKWRSKIEKDSDTEKRGTWRLGEKGEEIKQKKKKSQNS